jgi:uncharacterized protein (TIGR02145 family)
MKIPKRNNWQNLLKIANTFILSVGLMTMIYSCKKEKEKELFQPVLTTLEVSGITQADAVSGGKITDDGGSDVTSRGVCWDTSPIPTVYNNKTTDGAGSGSFVSTLSGLTSSTKYYLRAYATNSSGTAYGDEVSFITQNGNVTDIDGNIYNTVIIDNQLWMKENLNVTHYSDGTVIPNIQDDNEWQNLLTGAYCDYGNIPDSSATYGRLYNWYAVADSHNLCPEGWHIPDDAEWAKLIEVLGGGGIAGGKLKETGIVHWISPNNFATNQSGFTALPGGDRNYDGVFNGIGVYAAWWSSTEADATKASSYGVHTNYSIVINPHFSKNDGDYVRCVKNQMTASN